MARPLPKDVEKQIAGTARRSEIRSVAIACLMLGTAFGFGLGAAVFKSTGGSFYFIIGAAVVGLAWFLAARARNTKA